MLKIKRTAAVAILSAWLIIYTGPAIAQTVQPPEIPFNIPPAWKNPNQPLPPVPPTTELPPVEPDHNDNDDAVQPPVIDTGNPDSGNPPGNLPGSGAGGPATGGPGGPVVTVPQPVVPGDVPPGFTDVSKHWARADIEFMASRGVVKGFENLTFKPDKQVTRAEFAVLIQKILNLPGSKKTRFKDVKMSEWHSEAINTVAEYGLVTGYKNGEFKPGNKITRQEMTVIMVKAYLRSRQLDVTADPLSKFSDSGQIADWARPSMAAAISAGLMQGRSIDKLAPGATATRAEAVVMMKNLMSKLNLL